MPTLVRLPPELLLQIFRDCTLTSLIALTSSCRGLHKLLTHDARKLAILCAAAANEYGPQQCAIQLLTYNSAQPAHVTHSPALSIPLLQNLVTVGKVAEAFVDIYPRQKWRDEFVADRRLLRADEARRLRQAIYRLSLFSRAFHNPEHPRQVRQRRDYITPRLHLLHHYSTSDLAEMLDVFMMLRQLVRKICPSDADVRRKADGRHPGESVMSLPNTRTSVFSFAGESEKHLRMRTQSHPAHLDLLGGRPPGWGDEIHHYYVVEDMLKLDPAQILWLLKARHDLGKQGIENWMAIELHHANLEAHGGSDWSGSSVTVDECRQGRGFRQWDESAMGGSSWFANNGQTFEQTWDTVMEERGLDVGEIRQAVGDGLMGVAMSQKGSGKGDKVAEILAKMAV